VSEEEPKKSKDFEEETRETWTRVENTLGVIITAQLELSGRVAKLERPRDTYEEHTANYPPPVPVYQGPERRRTPQPSYTTDALMSVKTETEAQTPILRSIVPAVESANRKQWYAIIAVVAQTLAIIAYALVQARGGH